MVQSPLSDESKFCISFGNQGPRVWRKGGEAHSPSFLKSSATVPQSVMIWGVMWSAGVVHCVFWKQRHCTRLPRHLEHFMLPSADQLFKDADFIFQQDLAPAHTAKAPNVIKWPWCWCDWLASKLIRPECMGVLSRGKWEQETKKCRWAEATVKEPGLPYQLSKCHNLITSIATPNWGSN